MDFLFAMAFILIFSLILGLLSQRIGLPAVVGQIVAGILLGPMVLDIIHVNNVLTIGSDIGVVLLMFIAGLECDYELVKKYLKPALSVAVCGVILPVLIFTLYGKMVGQSMEHALFWGVIFSATSVSISVEVLQEFGKLKSVAGATILGAAVIDDVISIILLSLFSGFYGTGESQVNIFVLFGLQLTYFVLIYLAIKWIVPWMINLAEKLPVEAGVSIVGLAVCFLMAYLAEAAHLSSVLGAFFAGIAVAQTRGAKQITRSAHEIGYSFFIPIFFAMIGLEIDFKGMSSTWVLVLVMTILAILTKWLGCGFGAKISGLTWQDSNIVGSGMVSRGEMALIVAQIGLSSHLLAPSLYSEIILAIVLTTILSPIMLKFSIKDV